MSSKTTAPHGGRSWLFAPPLMNITPLCLVIIATSAASSVATDDAGQEPHMHRALAEFLGGSSSFSPASPLPTGVWGFDMAGMNTTLKPGENWYEYANGRWLDTTEIPPGHTRWSSFSMVSKHVTAQVRHLLEKATRADTLLGRFYTSYMNEQKVEELGTQPLKPKLRHISGLATASDFAAFCGYTKFGFGSSPFSYRVWADDKDPSLNVAYLSQSGLGLPNRDYYLLKRFAKQKKAYGEYMKRLLSMIDWPSAPHIVAKVLALENQIARASWTRADVRKPTKNYNKMLVSDLPAKLPGFDWDAFMRAVGPITGNSTVIVTAYNSTVPDGVTGIAKLLGQTDLEVLKAWSAFHLVNEAVLYLPKAFVNAYSAFKTVLDGQKGLQPRWQRGVNAASSHLDDAVGKEYIAEHFPASSRAKVVELTRGVQAAFAKRIKKLSWMTGATQAKALSKLSRFTVDIGYPKKFKDFTGLVLNNSDLFGNVERAIAFTWNFHLKRLGSPVDKDYWLVMSPQHVNAFFMPTQNKCAFPAAILQPPFYNPEADMSVNYGAIGAVIGHEITHGFDNYGRRFDADGKLHDWWLPADAEEFQKRAQAYGQQFKNFTQGLPAGLRIRPVLTMGENIADLGGLASALDAYRTWRERHDYTPTPPMLSGPDASLEGDRRFFAGYAQLWRGKYTQGALERQLTTGPHSPATARSTIPTQNLAAWQKAFGIADGDALFLADGDRVRIW